MFDPMPMPMSIRTVPILGKSDQQLLALRQLRHLLDVDADVHGAKRGVPCQK